eukprot:TRINITY_DN2374_c0_g1_i1.p1 TRINITY_DN2374_c0_g1~~TRINITY_DN2374_c0_g1_i1.p1  ORF type:complete len:339 (+),score=60.60 TRINITY_DN2374_c0_g1_i1:62-1078(+)
MGVRKTLKRSAAVIVGVTAVVAALRYSPSVGLVAAGAALALLRLAFWAARQHAQALQVVCYPAGSGGKSLTAVHLTDVHYDPRKRSMSDTMADRIVEEGLRAKPDVVFLTGDYVNRGNPAAAEKLGERLKPLIEATQGRVYASLGNHDSDTSDAERVVVAGLRRAGITVLHNESIVCTADGRTVVVTGLADRSTLQWSSHAGCLRTACAKAKELGATHVVLSHNPDTATTLARYTFDVQLSGHVHGGQFCLPGGMPVLQAARAIIDNTPPLRMICSGMRARRRWAYSVDHWEWASGKHSVPRKDEDGANTLIVSKGLGAHWGVRSFCPPEVVVLHLSV